MVKIKIEFDKTNCIGALACMAVDPKRWVDDRKENKVDLVNSKEVSPGIYEAIYDVAETEIPDIIASAEVCPVAVIGIINLDTGKVLFKREIKS